MHYTYYLTLSPQHLQQNQMEIIHTLGYI